MTQNPKEIFAANLSRLLEQRKISQADLVRALGLRQTTVSDWIKSKKYPRVEKLQLLSGYFGVPKTALTEPAEHGPSHPGSAAWLRDGLLARGVIGNHGDLTEEQLQAILSNMDMLALAYARPR